MSEADVRQDRIVVELSGTPNSGNLKVKAVCDAGDWTISDDSRGSGSHTFSFVLESMPICQYDRVVATWAADSTVTSEKSVNFRAMGVHTGTSYNTPAESACPGKPTGDGDYESSYGSCTFLDDVAKLRFMAELYENGSGRSDRHGLVQRPWQCHVDHHGKLRPVGVITGKWGPVNESTVAVGDTHPYVQGSNMNPTVMFKRGRYIDVKTVTDRCDKCPGLHLDHYSSGFGCTSRSVPSYGDYPAFHLK